MEFGSKKSNQEKGLRTLIRMKKKLKSKLKNGKIKIKKTGNV